MNIRLVKESIGKARINATRGDFINSLPLMLQGLREICISPGSPSIDIREIIREVVKLYDGDKSLKSVAGGRVTYTSGQEKTLYVSLKKIYESLSGCAMNESPSKALERKNKLDMQLILGKEFLSKGKVSDADEAFHEAIKFYRDENFVFSYIGKMFIDANQPVRASFYLKKAINIEPENQIVKAMIKDILRKQG